MRHTFSKNGGNLGEPNSVRFMFAKKGLIAVPKSEADEDKLMNIVLDAGGEDLNDEGDTLGDSDRPLRLRGGGERSQGSQG